ncbi:MAG TPA: glycoside hydrolase family 43 protein [Candidatus Limnocylindrales bacterium]|nr:glycoside hydrolase family 43 protein [Candidatus Limnocylindrales bacterium]
MPGKTFTNPVYDGYFADPFVLRLADRYFAYGTNDAQKSGKAFEILESVDLVHWQSIGRALDPVDGLDVRDHWAPEVAERDGIFYMYFSAGVEDREHRIRLAVADRPEGPFKYEGVVLTPDEPFAIDANPFRDDDGQWYLYYAHDVLEGERVGTSLAVDRLVDMNTLAGEGHTIVRATADWQLFAHDRQMYGHTYDWHTVEGAHVVKRLGRYWCFYSGGAWNGPTYGASWAVADSPLGPFTSAATDGPALLRTRPGEVHGPGHNSIVTTPAGVDYIVYHAWDPALTARRMHIDRLEWTPDGPRTAGPTITPQPIPR